MSLEDTPTMDVIDDDVEDVIEDDVHEDVVEDEVHEESIHEDEDEEKDIIEDDDKSILDLFSKKYEDDKHMIEVPFDKNKHIQYLTTNEFTRIYNNISEFINSGTITLPKNKSKNEYIIEFIRDNSISIKIKRPIDVNKYVVINLNELMFDIDKYRDKLSNM